MNNKFAFIIHPLDLNDIFRKYSFMRRWPRSLVNALIKKMPPIKASTITGVSSLYNQTEGCFIGVTLTPEMIYNIPTEQVLHKIIAAGKLAEKAGAKIVGLGALTAVIGDAGITIARELNIAVTTGNSYTVATALEGTKQAVKLMGKELENCEVAILGATGSIGSVCARILSREVKYLSLIARNESRLEGLARNILNDTGLAVKISNNVARAVSCADVIIAVSGAAECLISPEDLKPGAIVCDVARPRDVSTKVAETRDDVLVIEGGIVEVPGDVNFNFDFGFPPRTAYACMAETMILALENRFENFTLGRELTVKQVDEISLLAKKHGFRLAGFRSFERPVSLETIKRIKERADMRLKALNKGRA